MSLRFHEIAETTHLILNPITEDKLMLLGEIGGFKAGMRQLDLCCGKGEMLSRWAAQYGISGLGVDISEVFLSAAARRAAELGVQDRVNFLKSDAAEYARNQTGTYDIVSCIGATWIGNGLIGTLDLMKPLVKPDGLLLVGELYLIDPPPFEAYPAWGFLPADYTSLTGTLDRFEQAGCELVEMVLASPDSWDRYEAAQWMAVDDYLRAHPDDPEADALRRWIRENRRAYLTYGRRYLGWGVFVLRKGEA
jgi:16S rRNA G966 N2-methylase RsmD